MRKRHLIFDLIGAQHRLALIGFLMFIMGSQHVAAQSQLAQDAYAIFEGSCLICHGSDGAYRETLLIEHAALIDGGTVVPGNPDASELYKRLLGSTENGAQMPLGQPQLPAQSIDTIRRWILAGAPDWTATTTTLRRFITPREVLTSIESHLNSLSSFDRAFARYFTMTHLYNAGETSEILTEYRKAFSKLVNSLSWRLKITNPQPIDPHETIFYIDLRHYEWDRIDGWTKIVDTYPYHITFDAPEHLGSRNQLVRLQTATKTDVPSVHIDWFIATASTPPLYDDLLSLPSSVQELENRLEVDVARNLRDAPGIEVWRAGFNNSGVSNHNRVVERHTSRYGAYWKSYDFAGNVGTRNIFVHPFNFTHDGGEIIFNLPNGLQGYYLVDGSGIQLDEAPISIVSNPAASDPTVRNGISCIGCHTEGMKTFEDEVRFAIEGNPNPPYNKEHALRLYVEKSVMDALVAEDMQKYRVALEATGGTFSGVEPVSRFHEAYQGPVDAAYAAAVVGLETETFLERVRENTGLQNVGLLALDNPNGSVKRDTWTSSFRDVMYALDYPQQVEDTPVITQPDVLPGTHVHIPDANLRTFIAAELGKRPNSPITAEEMKRLKNLDACKGGCEKGIRDLTGVQFAINLSRINISHNQVSDLSPIAGLIELRELWITDNPVSDISLVRGLTNLTHLGFGRCQVSDISPVRNLENLIDLRCNDNLVSDISPVRGLINLTRLEIQHTLVADLSPVANLTKLKRLYCWDANISDLSPIARMTDLEKGYFQSNRIADLSALTQLVELTHLNFRDNLISDVTPCSGLSNLVELELDGNRISDISPLAGLTGLNRLDLAGNAISDVSHLSSLTNLKWLRVADNDISDVTPLARLTDLKWLGIYNNRISDLSPLEGLRENTTLLWHGNPVFPTDAPKIDASWLWVVLPYVQPSGSEDLLSKASGGTVTEVEVATHGAIEGQAVGDDVWTSRRLAPTGWNNVDLMLGNRDDTFRFSHMLYGTVSLYSPHEQETNMYVGSHNDFKVWLNGTLIYQSLQYHASADYTDFLPVTLKQGRNVLLVAVEANYNSFFGFETGAEYTLGTGIGYAFSETPVHIGDTFTFDVRADSVSNLAGWQFDLVFDPAVLEAVGVSEGDFLKSDGGTTFFQSGRIDNTKGKITGLIAGRISEGGASGSGSLLQVEFKAESEGETELTLEDFEFGSITGENIPAGPLEIRITVAERLVTGDVNRDGRVSILDLILVAQQLGRRVPPNSAVDINGDGMVNIFDLTLVAQGIAGAAAPAIKRVDNERDRDLIETWITLAQLEDDGSIAFRQGIANLQILLDSLIVPQETALHANYPNPFNPETWIPYQLAAPADVALTIYDMSGGVVRRLEMGHQVAGMYRNRSRAAYWDGRNQCGESVASGLYFYTLRAREFVATRKLLIRK